MNPVAAAPVRVQALSLLLARYIAGQVAEAQFVGMSDLFDESEASADERAAFARFYLDATADTGDIALPTADEMTDLLAIARA